MKGKLLSLLLLMQSAAGASQDCMRPSCSTEQMEANKNVCCLSYPCLLDGEVRKEWEQRAFRGEYGYAEILLFHNTEYGNEESALPWMRLAAVQGYPHGQFMYGKYLAKSSPGDEIVMAEAIAWMEMAARAPSRTFSEELAEFYLEVGNQDAGIYWMEMSARSGNEDAKRRLVALLLEAGDAQLACLWSLSDVKLAPEELASAAKEDPACSKSGWLERMGELGVGISKLRSELESSIERYHRGVEESCAARKREWPNKEINDLPGDSVSGDVNCGGSSRIATSGSAIRP